MNLYGHDCHELERYYREQCLAWEEFNIPQELPEGTPEAYLAAKELQRFQENLQQQLDSVTGSDNCPIYCRCAFCELDEDQDCLEADEEQDVLEADEDEELTDCERFIMECEARYAER